MIIDLIEDELIQSWYDSETTDVFISFYNDRITLNFQPDDLYKIRDHLNKIFEMLRGRVIDDTGFRQ